mgnify:CR=1 FL=1
MPPTGSASALALAVGVSSKAMVAMALWRRLTKRVKRLEGAETHPNDPLLILSWIGALMVTMFLTEAFAIAAEPLDRTGMALATLAHRGMTTPNPKAPSSPGNKAQP